MWCERESGDGCGEREREVVVVVCEREVMVVVCERAVMVVVGVDV